MTVDLWIFAYGSLLWDPGFVPAEARPARLLGWRRSFCMRSIRYRGTDADPGLVLALDAVAGADCAGLALRVAPEEAQTVLAAARARELVTGAYLEKRLPVLCADGTTVEAVTYVINPDGGQYCAFDEAEQAQIIARASGARGPNREYLWATAERLAALGLADPALERLAERVRALTAQATPDDA